MSTTERLRKVIQELLDTERSYVKDLSCLFEIYLKPLQKETFLTLDEMDSLFGSLPEMLVFQKVFLQTLEEKICSSPALTTLDTPPHFKKLLFSLGGSFLYYADHFKLYSGFCANHTKVQKVLERAKTDRAFKAFLEARNPTKQHSSTLESYLIKPVQRVLKYPLLLRELASLTHQDSHEHYHLTEALKAMEQVASHMNAMQQIYEDYGGVFEQLVAEQSGPEKEVTELSMGEFLTHSTASWLNPPPSLGRMRKDPQLTVFVFKKAVILVYRENYKLKKKMPAPRSTQSQGDQEFRFRWLIPLSALHVRLGNTAGESSCVWELVHGRSELEGRPETRFQLCSSVPECKVIRVIRSVLRENVRRTLPPTERTVKERLGPLRSTLPSSARIGSTRASWVPAVDPAAPAAALGPAPPDSADEGGGSSSGTPPNSSGGPSPCSSARPLPHPPPPARPPRRGSSQGSSRGRPRSASLQESSRFPGDDEAGRTEGGGVEARFLRLALSESVTPPDLAPLPCHRVQPEGAEASVDPPQLTRRHRSDGSQEGAPQSAGEHGLSAGRRTGGGAGGGGDDRSAALREREFSVQSLTSAVNEDCFFYEPDRTDATHTASATS